MPDILQFVDAVGDVAAVTDAFGRTVSGGWGVADSGQAWSTSGGSASDYSVSGGRGRHAVGSLNVSRWTILPVSARDVTITGSSGTDVLATGGSHYLHVAARLVDVSNCYMARLEFTTSQQVILTLRARVGASDTVLGTFTTGITHAAGAMIACKLQVAGPTIRAKAWLASGSEPAGWQLTATDTSLPGPGAVGVRSLLSSSNTNTLPVNASWDDVTVAGSANLRLDLNDDAVWSLNYEGTDFSPPNLRRAMSQTLLADGGLVAAAAYDNRLLKLRLDLHDTSLDSVALRIQALNRELNRTTNVLMWQPGTSSPVFFRTMRSTVNRVTEVPGPGTLKLIDVEILAEPFAYGLKETLSQVTVYADPAEGTTLNANPFFETDISNWTGVGGTIIRSTAQFHEGAASLLLTPDGVTASVEARSEFVPVTALASYRASAWVRCAVARNLSVAINWYDSGGGFLSQSVTTPAVSAATWTFIELTASAPASAAQARLIAGGMSGTPPASNTVYVDEARVRRSGGVGGCCFDVTGVKGDVETPLHLSLDDNLNGTRQMVFATRRRGTPAQMPFLLQAESMDRVSDTALGASNDTAMSGGGQNYVRVPFVVQPGMATRVSLNSWPTAASNDVRGTYRVYARVRRNVGADAISLRLMYGTTSTTLFGDTTAMTSAAITDPMYVDVGLVQFPLGNDPVTDLSGVDLPAAGMFVGLQAQRVSGTGTLDIDYLLFVPADDRLMAAALGTDPSMVSQVIDSTRTMVYGLGSSGELRPTVQSQIVGAPPMVSPGQTNRVVVFNAPQLTGGDTMATSRLMTASYWPRYLYVRPVAS